MPLVPDVISCLCSTVPTEMRHSRDIVQACPGGGPVIPNQSLAVQCLERKIRTQKFRFSFFFFFNECLIQNCVFPPFLLPDSHEPSFYFVHLYLHIILIIYTLSLVSLDGFISFHVTQIFLGTNVFDRESSACTGGNMSVCTFPAMMRNAVYYILTLIWY